MPSPYAPPTYGGSRFRDPGVPDSINELYGSYEGSRAPGSSDMTPVISLGGMGSKYNDAYQRMVGKVAPNAIQIPLGEMGLRGAEAKLIAERARLQAEGKKWVEIGHSLGGTLIHNKANTETNRTAINVDPPWNPPWRHAPRWLQGMIPTARAISDASRSGIQHSPDTVSFTGGATVMNPFNRKAVIGHSPWNNPAAPGNQANIDALQDLLRSRMNTFTNPPAKRP